MNNFSDLKYLINGEPASADDLINEAKELSEDFRASFFRSTSQAAFILRDNGFTVSDNPDFKVNNDE